MSVKTSFLCVSLSLLNLISCQKPSSSSVSNAPAQTPATGTTTQGVKSQTSSSGTSGTSSSMGDLSSLQALLGGLTGGGSGAGAPGGLTGSGTGTSSGAGTTGPSIQWSTYWGASFLSFQLYDVQKNFLTVRNSLLNAATNADTFDCPGDSLLVGFRGLYDLKKGDRQMQPYCQFFEDSSGVPLKKQNCANIAAIAAGTDAKQFQCPAGKLLAGFRPIWMAAASDRAYEFECCELVNSAGKTMTFAMTTDPNTNASAPTCERYPGSAVQQGNRFLGTLDFHCQGSTYSMQTGQPTPTPTAIYTVYSSYMAYKTTETSDTPSVTQNDRIWNFDCCVLSPSN